MAVKLKTKLLTYIQGTFANSQTAELMANHPSEAFDIVGSPACADVVVFTGGDDIDPGLYGEPCLPGTYWSKKRDNDDLYILGMTSGAIHIGICRGAQLLNVINGGGSMWQDVSDHGFGEHRIKDYVTGDEIEVNTLHHQMMRPSKHGLIVAGCTLAKTKYGYESLWQRDKVQGGDLDIIDPEVVWYEPGTLCFQPHPEFGHVETRDYFYELVDRYVLKSSKIERLVA